MNEDKFGWIVIILMLLSFVVVFHIIFSTEGIGTCEECDNVCMNYCEENVENYTHYKPSCTLLYERCHCSCKEPYVDKWKLKENK